MRCFDLCARRDVPILFCGELGSVNPMFLMPDAVSSGGADLAAGWAVSLTMEAGQFCTNPGVVVVMSGPDGYAFVDSAVPAGAVLPEHAG